MEGGHGVAVDLVELDAPDADSGELEGKVTEPAADHHAFEGKVTDNNNNKIAGKVSNGRQWEASDIDSPLVP